MNYLCVSTCEAVKVLTLKVCPEDWAANDRALTDGDRLLSSYLTDGGTKVWIITEWDRSITTVLLPEEY